MAGGTGTAPDRWSSLRLRHPCAPVGRPAGDGVPDVRLVELTKRYRDILAVDGVSLDIDLGEFFSLLGPSGCGKTTMDHASVRTETPPPSQTRLPSLGPRGEGWVAIQVVLFVLLAVAGSAGPAWATRG